MTGVTTVGDLRPGRYDLTLSLKRGETKRVRGKVIEGKTGKHLIARCSPKHSFGPGTQVVKVFDYRKKEVKPKVLQHS